MRYTHIMLDRLTDEDITRILTDTRVIAMVGASPRADRPSNQVGHFLAQQGYKVIPVNPGQAGKELFGQRVVASLSEIDEPVDMVDIFRRSEAVEPVVEEALRELKNLKYVWMQIGVVNEKAAALAVAHGAEVAMDRCPKIEIPRLGIAPVS
ncbi:CoA-binding protein [Celeribacter sp.]|uniref:CoA-binding protein n=1 Tax=Celeribacter sp. TaxID=1890673 RepID=UPI003A915E97